MSSEELIDVLSESGETTGMVRSRREVHGLGLWHRTVHVWIVNLQGEILLQKRSRNKETFPGIWDVSAAGHVSAGDASIDAAIRETHEELGLRVQSAELKRLFTIRQQCRDAERGMCDNEITDVYLIRRDVGDGELSVDAEEVAGTRWMGIGALRKAVVLDRDSAFAPHGEEYVRLLDALSRFL